MIYLDNAASTPIAEPVLSEMLPYLKEQFGNPSSIHRYGRIAHKAIEKARIQIANLIGALPEEILITSGGTESNNTAISGVISQSQKKHIISSSIEHDAVLEPLRHLEKKGYHISYLPVDGTGTVDISKLDETITDDTCLVSVMFVNNEVGTVQPIENVSKICKSKNVIFHSDAVQAIGKFPIDVSSLGVDLLSISAHKINGPKGVGALYVRKGTKIDPLIFGGGQENGLRSGTENVASIVGFGKACAMAKENLESNTSKLKQLRDLLVNSVLSEIKLVSFNGHPINRSPNNAHFTFLGVSGEDLIIKLDEYGIAASTGSACSVRIQKASHVLQAMGFSHEQITGSLRLTVGINNTPEEILQTVATLKKVVLELRSVSPFKEKYGF